MRAFLTVLLIIAGIGVLVGESLRGFPVMGLFFGGLVLAGAWDVWTRPDDAAQRLALYLFFIASALPVWDTIEAWIERILS
jgi:hypothetical protein